MKRIIFQSLVITLISSFLIILVVAGFICVYKGIEAEREMGREVLPSIRIVEATAVGTGAVDTETLFLDNQGNYWSAYLVKPLLKGQKVALEISTKGTETLEDDEITNLWIY